MTKEHPNFKGKVTGTMYYWDETTNSYGSPDNKYDSRDFDTEESKESKRSRKMFDILTKRKSQ